MPVFASTVSTEVPDLHSPHSMPSHLLRGSGPFEGQMKAYDPSSLSVPPAKTLATHY